MSRVIVATSVGRTEHGSHLVLFPSRCTCNSGAAKPFTYFPYELAYCTAVLKRDTAHTVKMVDGNLRQLDAAQYIELLSEERPEWLVMEVAAVDYAESLKVAAQLKRRFGTKVIFAGAYATARPEQVGREVDYVCLGEYEYAVRDILRGETNAAGVYPHGMSGLIDLNSLPFPDDEDIHRMDYDESSCEYPLAQVYASRGCPLKCSFCVAGNLYYSVPLWRPRSVVSVVDEIALLRAKYGGAMQGAFFNEEIHNASRQFVFDLCAEIKRRGLHTLHYEAMCGYWMFDEEMLAAMKEAGYYQVRFGIETIDSRLAARMKSKPVSLEKLERFLSAAKRIGIKTYATAFVGSLESSMGRDLNTHNYLAGLVRRGLLDKRQVSVAIPQPGTPFFDECGKKGYIFTGDLGRFDYVHPVMSYPHYPAEQIQFVFNVFLNKKDRNASLLDYLIWKARRACPSWIKKAYRWVRERGVAAR